MNNTALAQEKKTKNLQRQKKLLMEQNIAWTGIKSNSVATSLKRMTLVYKKLRTLTSKSTSWQMTSISLLLLACHSM